MIASDVITLAQNLSGEGPAGQRFSDAQMLNFVDRAQKLIVRDLKWPPSRFTFTTVPTVQEYQLQEVIKIMQVYVNGQIMRRTSIPTMEGQQIQFNDQTGQGGGPGGLVVANQAPVLKGSSYTPQWTSQGAAAYPVANSFSVAPYTAPWFPGLPPAYYTRGGNIGFVPAPAGAVTVVCDVVAQPATITTDADSLVLPDLAVDALAWKVVEYMAFSDRGVDNAADNRNYAMTEYGKALGELRSWKRDYDGVGPNGPKPLTYRSFYVRGQRRNGGF